MNQKVTLYRIACYVNLYSIIIMLVIIIYRLIPTSFTKDGKFIGREIDILGFGLLFVIFIIFLINFFYGIKLIARFDKAQEHITFNNGLRILFFILEIIVAFIYSVGIYQIISGFELIRFWNLPIVELIIYVFMHLCLITGFLSSLIRIILTRYVLKQAKLLVKSDIDIIGEAWS